MTINQLGNRVFEVGSESTDRTYVVNMSGPHATCTCTAFAITRNREQGLGHPPRPCKHIRQVEDTGAISAVEDLKALLVEMSTPVVAEMTDEEAAASEWVERGRRALDGYAPLSKYADGLPADRVRDLLCDVMHACRADNVDFTYGLEMAQEHFEEETGRG